MQFVELEYGLEIFDIYFSKSVAIYRFLGGDFLEN
jgi:hypothetical protein